MMNLKCKTEIINFLVQKNGRNTEGELSELNSAKLQKNKSYSRFLSSISAT